MFRSKGLISEDLCHRGHSWFYNTLEPIHACNIWNIDTGAGWSGKLTIIDVDSKKYWQSDLTPDIYGGKPNQLY